MHIFVPIDDREGLLFNRRRQSRDRALMEEMLLRCGPSPLRISPFSQDLFTPEEADRIAVSEDFLDTAQAGDFCLCEDRALAPYEDRIESLTLCRWNRDYPGDFFLDLDLAAWRLQETKEIPGTSHDTITLEVYVK